MNPFDLPADQSIHPPSGGTMNYSIIAISHLTRCALHAHLGRCDHDGVRCGSDRGEGVISTAIAVLIMAFLGVAMWVGFNQIWSDAESTTGDQVRQIGR